MSAFYFSVFCWFWPKHFLLSSLSYIVSIHKPLKTLQACLLQTCHSVIYCVCLLIRSSFSPLFNIDFSDTESIHVYMAHFLIKSQRCLYSSWTSETYWYFGARSGLHRCKISFRVTDGEWFLLLPVCLSIYTLMWWFKQIHFIPLFPVLSFLCHNGSFEVPKSA